MDAAIATGALVRFTRKVTRFVRDIDFKDTGKQHDVPRGTIGIVLGMADGSWGNTTKRPVVFTAQGFRICELPENLEVLCRP